MNSPIVTCSAVSKHYDDIVALKNINLEINPGEIFGVIGPDGAGKTSLFRLIATLLIPDSGSISVMGYDTIKDYREIRKSLGYMPGRFSLYPDLSVGENLAFYASVYGSSIEENYHLIEDVYVQIEPFRKRRAGKLSGGMKQKLALCCALIHSPQLLILDEPTTGVDAVSRREFWDMLKGLKEKGMTILVSTPYMDEAKRCDRIALFQNGEMLKLDTPEMVISQFEPNIFAIRSNERHEIIRSLNTLDSVFQAYLAGQLVHFTQESFETDFVGQFLKDQGFKDFEIMAIKPDIEDCFINLMMK